MSLGKQIRLNRIFAHPSGRLCSVAIDHLLAYSDVLPPGLRHIRPTLAKVAAGQPDAVTMHKGLARALWREYAGKIPLILQSSAVRPDDTSMEQVATVEDAVYMGADALAIVAYVHGDTEAAYLRNIADAVRASEPFGLPVISHVYPRDPKNGLRIVYHPENIAWAVRCMVEMGVDVVKVPYCGNLAAHRDIVNDCPLPLVAAGGPQTPTLADALRMMADAVAAGVRGATIGRNIWGHPDDVTGAVRAFKAIIHDGASAEAALALVG